MSRMMQNDPRTKTICFVAAHAPSSLGWGGVVRSVKAYITLANIAGYRTELIASSASLSGTVSKQSVLDSCPLDDVHLYRASLSKKWAIGFGIFLKLRALFRSDVVIIYGVRVWPLAIAAGLCRVFGRRFIIIPAAGLDSTRASAIRKKRPFLYSVYKIYTKWTLKGSSSIVVSGALEAGNLEQWVPRDRITHIQNFFSFDLQRPYIDPPHRKRYIFVGRLAPDKGILGFLRIWQATASPESEFLLVGTGDGTYFSKLQQMVASDSRIKYLGELENRDVYEAILSSSVLVLPTGVDLPVTENFGNVVVESFICGRPVMVSSGLHWDEFRDEQAINIFELNDNAIRSCITAFEKLDDEIFILKSKEAFKLASRFHYSQYLERFQMLISQVQSGENRHQTTRTIYVTVIRYAPGLYRLAIAVANALRWGDRKCEVMVSKEGYVICQDDDFVIALTLQFIWQVLRNFCKRRPGLVFYFWNNHPMNILFALLAYAHPNWRTIICCHEPRKDIRGLPLTFRVRRAIAEAAQSIVLKLSDAANVVSEHGHHRFRNAYPNFRKPIFRTGLFFQDLGDGVQNTARDLVCFPGAPNGSTGHEDFFRIAPALSRAGVKLCLFHVGAPDSEFWITPAQLADSGFISSGKILTDDDIFKVFQRSVAVLRFDKTSSQSATIPVAFMAGTPVIVRRAPGLIADVAHGSDGVILDENIDVDGVLTALNFINENLDVMREAARETYLKKFDLERNKSKILEMFEAVDS